MMVHDKTKWLIAAARIVGATIAITILTVRTVYGAESSPIPDGLTGPALISAALVYMARTIYELTLQRKNGATNTPANDTDPRMNAAAWTMLTQHMDREEKLFEQVTAAHDRVAAALTTLTIQISK